MAAGGQQILVAQLRQLREAMQAASAAGSEAVAEQYAGKCADLVHRNLGSTAAMTLGLRAFHLAVTAYREPPELEERLRELVGRCSRELGPLNNKTTFARRVHIQQTMRDGRLLHAERLAEALAQETGHALGRDDRETRAARRLHALTLAALGRCGEALAIVDSLDRDKPPEALFAQPIQPARPTGPQDAIATVRDEPDETEAAAVEAAAGVDDICLVILMMRGRWSEADAVLAVRAERRLRRFGPLHPEYLKTLILRSAPVLADGDPQTALDLSAQGSDGLVERRGFEAYDNYEAYVIQSRALAKLGDPLQAETAARYTFDQTTARWGSANHRAARAAVALASALIAQYRSAEALALAEPAAAALRASHGDMHPAWLEARFTVAQALAGVGRSTEARAAHQAILADRVRILGEEHPHTRSSYLALTAHLPDTP